MAAEFEESSNFELKIPFANCEESDISKGLEAIPVRLKNTIKIKKSFQVFFV